MTTPVSTLMPEPTTATLDRAWIAAHIPHDGAMCVLDRVEAWDAARIRCSATSHRDPRNPLRSRGRLASVCGIEYAAQAMAVHGALVGAQRARTEPARPRAGYLASVRNVDAFVDRLDTFDLPLIVDAERIGGDDRSVLYSFTLRCGERMLLGGRAVVMLDASAASGLVPPPAGRADIR
ncbi:3-hydroxylacyl-ACP dehydratase [Burkholderia diffusa]|uniref:hotdog family protein n=1 Tax=Burkholderia diffusa TaxID=488732 RepID=UPI0007593C5F|nr:hotdog family protein [Burkholderia diffusa]KUZ14023.1 3-hydroxylacyl-ACP dehydratase [Burkholderia diffusa]KVC10957.1 3-hydroxylacyl-ACP dehydratase [Burkholderia diffusa]KVH41933.1 3-hydroxylacyl-ACP dehydratase [Burkholderia diffusa]KWF91533.1 3-hydroxylacyl-ACP dehydratase [Burkholderia diffusa]